MDRIEVLIIDEHSAVCQALASRLKAVSSIHVVGATCDFAEGKRVAEDEHPDVIILELKTSASGDGRKASLDPTVAISELLAASCGNIVVLTSYHDEVEQAHAIGAGAKRYLLKDIDTARLVSEIERVARDQFTV